MIEKLITSRRNVIDFARYQQDRAVGKAQAISARVCRHCGAALSDGENEDECSSALNIARCFCAKNRGSFTRSECSRRHSGCAGGASRNDNRT